MLPAKVANPSAESMPTDQPNPEEGFEVNTKQEDVSDILLLMRILLKNPPPDHDCRTCPICRKYGITEL